MKIKQNLVASIVFLFAMVSVPVLGTESASAAFYNKESDCTAANGVWWEGRCWLTNADGKARCQSANGTWHTIPLNTAPIAVGLALVDPAGYCEVRNQPDDGPDPHECQGNIDAVTGECVEHRDCKKYTNEAVRNACIKGHTQGSQACERYSGRQKEACLYGAEKGGHDDNDPDTDGGVDGCGDIQTSLIRCTSGTGGGNPVIGLLLQVVNFLAVGVGIAVVGGIIWGGMLYASSNGDSAKAKKGITTIVNAVVGLLLFIFMYALINFLVPGGLFR